MVAQSLLVVLMLGVGSSALELRTQLQAGVLRVSPSVSRIRPSLMKEGSPSGDELSDETIVKAAEAASSKPLSGELPAPTPH